MKNPPKISKFEIACLIIFPLLFGKSLIAAIVTKQFYHIFFAILWFFVSMANLAKLMEDDVDE